jgi:Uma2 family endonuclease
MATDVRLKLGLGDHGRRLSLDEFWHADYEEGYCYEIIDGRLYVSPQPNLPEGRIDRWIDLKLVLYAHGHPEVINYVHAKPRVFVHARPEATVPEPDVAAYHDFPLDQPLRGSSWENISPILVVEVLSPNDPDKDLDRNVELYLLVPSIKEYWILDGRDDPDRPTLIVRRRHGKRWVVRRHEGGETFTTRLLPGFELLIDPHR